MKTPVFFLRYFARFSPGSYFTFGCGRYKCDPEFWIKGGVHQ